MLPARRVHPRTIGALVGLLVVIAAVGLWWKSWNREPARRTELSQAVDEELAEPVVDNPGYLGPQACATCHAARVAEFQGTRHYLANCVPRDEIMPAGFLPGHGDYDVPDFPIQFHMARIDDHFVQRTLQKGAEPSRASSSQIAFIYGAAGGNDEVYFTWSDRHLNELPMVWLGPQQQWGASPFDRHAAGDFSRETTIRCVECHNTWFQHFPGSRNEYGRDNFLIGVSCEVCHGPGRDHVDFHRGHPESTDAHAVVRPARLSRERLMDLCAQCHSNALKHRGPAFQYRPGDPLDEHYVTLKTKHPEDDHVANQTTYLRQSRCFQHSETMTCVTCHNPHQPRSATNAGSHSCQSCHQSVDCTDRDRLPAAVQSDCIGCHMPARRKIQVHFRTATEKYVAPVKRYEHKIGVYPLARQAVLLEWLRAQTDPASRAEASRISSELARSWRSEAEQRQQEHRLLAAIDACRESLSFDPDTEVQQQLQELISLQSGIDTDYQEACWHEREQRYPQAIAAFQRVLKAKPDYAMSHARLGTTYALSGETPLARKHLQLAVEYDENDPYAPAMLGWLAYLDGRPNEALEHYRRADAVEPYSAKINQQIGLALARLQRWPEAVEKLKKAVTIDPGDANAFLALSQALRHLPNSENDVLKYGLQAARLTRFEEPEILLNLANAYADVNRWEAAIETAEKALAIATPLNAQHATQIRIRLDELRLHRKK